MSSGGEKETETGCICTGEKTFTGEIQRKQTRVKVKIRSISAERCRYHFWTRCPEVEKIQRSIRKQMLLDRMSKSPREQKPERSLKAILCSRTALLRRKPERSRVEKLPAMTTATGTPIIRHRKGQVSKAGDKEPGASKAI